MIILAVLLILVGSLVPMDPRGKNAMVISGIVLLVLAILFIFLPNSGYLSWPFRY